MAVKCTWLFNGFSSISGLSWGFSESWYSGLSGDALIGQMDYVSNRRADILSGDTQIVGYRIGQTTGRSFVVRKTFGPPQSNSFSNFPVDSVLCQVGGDIGGSRKKFFLHDLPDGWVEGTGIVSNFAPRIRAVVNAIAGIGFQFRAINQAAATVPILSVAADGTVTTAAAIVLAANQTVQFLNCRDVNGRAIRGTFIVDGTPTGPTVFKVAHWGGQTVGRSGKVRLSSFNFTPAVYLGVNETIIRAGARKVGRPFFQLRGRVPVRK